MAKSGGANILRRKYFYGKNLNPMEHLYNSGGVAALYSSTLSAAYDFISNSSILLPVHVCTAKRLCM